MSRSLCGSLWMAADAHCFCLLFYEQHLGGTDCILLIWTLIKISASTHPPSLFLSASLSLSFRRWRLPVRALRKRRHLRRQGWLIPLPLPAQLWRGHVRKRWEDVRRKRQRSCWKHQYCWKWQSSDQKTFRRGKFVFDIWSIRLFWRVFIH